MRKDFSLSEFSELVSSINRPHQDLSSLLSTIMETTKEALDCEGCSLLLYNKEEDCLEFLVSRGEKSEFLQFLRVPKGKGIAGYVMETQETVVVNDAQSDPRLYKEIDQKVGFVTKNLLCVPMLAKGVFIGVLEAVNTLDDRNFEKADADLLKHISEVSAIAINNRYLFEELSDRLHEINGLLKISQNLSQVKDIDEFLDASGDAIAEFLGVSRISYINKNSQTGKWRIRYSRGLPMSHQEIRIEEEKGVLAHILLTKEALLVENINKHDHILFPFTNNYRTKSFISIPIILEEQVIGVLNLTDKWNQKPFQKTDLKLLKIITNYMIEVYQSLMARIEREKYAQVDRDLETAKRFQSYSLPTIPSHLEGLELASIYQPSKEIGGDFYDLIYHWDGLFSLVIGDVSGKGITSALFMQLSKTVLNTQISRNIFPARALLHSHRILQENFESNMLVEIMVVQVDTEERIVKYASAGHNRQFYYRKKTKELGLLRARGIPLGTRLEIGEFGEETISYESGDILILYTDGITECSNSDEEMFGEERLAEIIQTYSHLHAKELAAKIEESTNAFSNGKEIQDDYTILVVKF